MRSFWTVMHSFLTVITSFLIVVSSFLIVIGSFRKMMGVFARGLFKNEVCLLKQTAMMVLILEEGGNCLNRD